MNENLKNLQYLNARANQIGKQFYQCIERTIIINKQIYELLQTSKCNVKNSQDISEQPKKKLQRSR